MRIALASRKLRLNRRRVIDYGVGSAVEAVPSDDDLGTGIAQARHGEPVEAYRKITDWRSAQHRFHNRRAFAASSHVSENVRRVAVRLRDELRVAIQAYADAVAADALAAEGHTEWHEEAAEVLCAKARVLALLNQVPAKLEASLESQAPSQTMLRLRRAAPWD